ncbi:MAG: hypothetical protein LQ340_002611 [Diploschistes diacapsis]|nr:MAG: hypothetical protein LQ340_002611 [Diploschistes diacapsis]
MHASTTNSFVPVLLVLSALGASAYRYPSNNYNLQARNAYLDNLQARNAYLAQEDSFSLDARDMDELDLGPRSYYGDADDSALDLDLYARSASPSPDAYEDEYATQINSRDAEAEADPEAEAEAEPGIPVLDVGSKIVGAIKKSIHKKKAAKAAKAAQR